MVAVLFQLIEGLRNPSSFGRPICNGGGQFPLFFHRLVNGGVKVPPFDKWLHNPDLVGSPFGYVRPVIISFLEHPRNQIDIDILDTSILGPLKGTEHFTRAVGTPIGFENVIRKIFDTQAEAVTPKSRIACTFSVSVPGSHSKVTFLLRPTA